MRPDGGINPPSELDFVLLSLLPGPPSSLCLSPGADLLLSDDACDTTSDLMLAQMLQMQFDREFDDQLRREEKKFNRDSKGRRAVTHLSHEMKLCRRVEKNVWHDASELFQGSDGLCSCVCVQCPSPLRTTGWFIRMKTATARRTRWTGRTPDTTPTKPVTCRRGGGQNKRNGSVRSVQINRRK